MTYQKQWKDPALSVSLKVLHEKLTEYLPTYATPGSAALDIRAAIDKPMHLLPGQTALIRTGFAMQLPHAGLAAILLPRSGLGNLGLVLGNLVGLIDSDYTDEVLVSAWNRSEETRITIEPWQRICQMVVVPVIEIGWNIVDELEPTQRSGGFGHTGVA
jgi:dUTP pyrophosphatase